MKWPRNLDDAPALIVALFFTVCIILGIAIIWALGRDVWEAPLLVPRKVFENSTRLVGALKNTAALFIFSFVFQLGVAFFGTYWIHSVRDPVKVLLVIPYAAGVVAPAFSIYAFFSPALGPLDALTVGVLGTEVGAVLVISFLDSWQWAGILLLACFFKLEQVPDSHFEQARLEGASRVEAWWQIVWPAISGVVFLFFLVRAIDWFRKVDTVKVLFGQGGPGYVAETIGMYISRNYFFAHEKSYAAFLVLLQLILLGIMLTLVFRLWLARWLGDGE